jgi:hypothetical protein
LRITYILDEFSEPVNMQDFEKALSKIQSSVSAADVKRYEDWMKEFGRDPVPIMNYQFPRRKLITVLTFHSRKKVKTLE